MYFDLNQYLQPKIDDIIANARPTLEKVHAQLQDIYCKELMPGHKPSFWDFHKARHIEKTNMANLLNQKLSQEIDSVEDIEAYLLLHEAQKERNFQIDKKGGRYGKILQEHYKELERIHGEIISLHGIRKDINFWMRKIINHYIVLEKEAYVEDEVHYNTKDALDLKSCHDFHISGIKHGIQNLNQIFENVRTSKGWVDNPLKTINITKNITDGLDAIEHRIRLDNLEETSEIGKRNKLYQAKVAFLRKMLQIYEHNQLAEDISQSLNNIHSLKNLSLVNKVKIFAVSALINHFSDSLFVNQKVLFWKFILASMHQPLEYLLGTERKKRKDMWLRGCYEEKLTSHLYDIKESEVKDPLNLQTLVRELKSLNFQDLQLSELIETIQSIEGAYINSSNNIDVLTQDYKSTIIRSWHWDVVKAFSLLKANLTELFKITEDFCENKNHSISEANQVELLQIVKFIYDKIESFSVSPSMKQSQQNTASLSCSNLRLFKLPPQKVEQVEEENALLTKPDFFIFN